MIKIFGNPKKFALNLKVLNNLGSYSDCTFSIIVDNYEVGELDEKKIDSLDFIECNNLRLDIIECLKSLENLKDISSLFEKYSEQKIVENILYQVYCGEVEEKDPICNSIVFLEHSSMNNYFVLLIRKEKDIFFISAKQKNIEGFDEYCNGSFNIDECFIKQIDIEETKNVLIEVKNFLNKSGSII